MTSASVKAVCRLLIALAVWAPYQLAQAGMIRTEQLVQAPQAERGTVLNFLSRGDVASELQAFGIDPATAKDRVAAMTDAEAQQLAGKINAVPAAGADVAGLLLLIVVIAVIWWAWKR